MRTIINGRCIVPNSDSSFCIKDNVAVIFDNKIKSIVPTDSIDVNHFDEVIDACGQYVSPGFINIHIHGCAGFDTMDENDNALYQMRHFLPSTGVTSFLPTTMTMPLNQIYNSLNKIRSAMNDTLNDSVLAKVLGANVEGPYISSKFKGAQAEDNIRRANFDEIAEFADVIKIITIAPEELGDTNFIKNCHKNNIIVSIGHSAADYDTAIETINNDDVKHITHLFNAQTGLHHRKPGIVGAALDTDAFVELIADNLHVHPAAQRLVYKVKKRSEIILITDSLRACGMGDGIYDLGGQKVYVKDNVATLEDGTIAASIAPMNKVVANFKNNTNISMAELVELVTKNPAIELGLYNKIGSLETGKVADIIIFDEGVNITTAIINGIITKSVSQVHLK